jgi:hypothetical protein
MKSTVAALSMLAAVASAYHPGRHLHFPRGNATATENLTTLTVKTTLVHTITSCAPTVTNCPAHATGIANLPESQKTTMVVTDTIILTETVCPVSDVPKISSSVIAQASTGGLVGSTLVPTVTHSIQPTLPANASSVEATKPGVTTKVIPVVTSKTVTMTLGSGSSASVATTVIPVTTQKTITEANADATGVDQTTTTTATTKITRTITVSRPHPTGNNGGSGSGNGNGNGNGNGGSGAECAASTVTVTVAKETVTVPASTVYVTIGSPSVTAADNEEPTATQPAATNKPVTTSKPGDSDESGDCEDETTTMRHTITVVPYPIGNGTHTSGSPKPSGFARLHR